jgi:hypothetical protein
VLQPGSPQASRTSISAPEIVAWDKRLDDWLIQHNVRAKTPENEADRFGFGLRDRLESVELRYGSGFFNAVLDTYLRTSDFASQPSVAAKLAKVRENAPLQGESASDCAERIKRVLASCARDDLMKALGYDRYAAVSIRSNAVAYYLDERFNITSRALLGPKESVREGPAYCWTPASGSLPVRWSVTTWCCCVEGSPSCRFVRETSWVAIWRTQR